MSEKVWWCQAWGLGFLSPQGDCQAHNPHHGCGWHLLVDPARTLIVEKREDGVWPKWALDLVWDIGTKEWPEGSAWWLDALKMAYDSQGGSE